MFSINEFTKIIRDCDPFIGGSKSFVVSTKNSSMGSESVANFIIY